MEIHIVVYAVQLYQVIYLKNCSNSTHCVMILNSSYKTELYSNGVYNAVF